MMNSKLNYDNEARKRRMNDFFKKNSENLYKSSSPKESVQEIFDILFNKLGKDFSKELKQELKDKTLLLCKESEKPSNHLENFKTIYLEMLDHCKFSIITLEEKSKILLNELENIKKNQSNKISEGTYFLVSILELCNVKSIVTEDNLELAVEAKFGQGQSYKTHFSFIDKGRIIWNETLQMKEPDQSGESLNLFIIDKTYDQEKLFFFAKSSLKVEDITLDSQKEYHQRMVDKNGKETQLTLNLKIMKISSTLNLSYNGNNEIEKERDEILKKIDAFDYKLNELFVAAFEYEPEPAPKEERKSLEKKVRPIISPPRHEPPKKRLENRLAPTNCEKRMERKMHEFFHEHGIENWVRILFHTSLYLLIVATILSMMRVEFLDILIPFGIFTLFLSNENTGFYFRCGLLALFISILYDLSWIILFTTGWLDSFETPLESGKIFHIVISYILFFYKIIYIIIVWKCSVEICEERSGFKDRFEHFTLYSKIEESQLEDENSRL